MYVHAVGRVDKSLMLRLDQAGKQYKFPGLFGPGDHGLKLIQAGLLL
jgi:hypothetical protein